MTKPNAEDYARIERDEGPLPENASDEQRAYRYQLAVAAMLIRLHLQPDE